MTHPESDDRDRFAPVADRDEEGERGLAEPAELVDEAEDEADTGSRLSMAASDPPASWAGPDVPPENRR